MRAVRRRAKLPFTWCANDNLAVPHTAHRTPDKPSKRRSERTKLEPLSGEHRDGKKGQLRIPSVLPAAAIVVCFSYRHTRNLGIAFAFAASDDECDREICVSTQR